MTEINHEESQEFKADGYPQAEDDWSFFDGDDNSPQENIETSQEEVEPQDEQEKQNEPVMEPQSEVPPQQSPLFVLKHNGQEIPISDTQQMIALAQQGLDYTQKTQALAAYRREVAALESHGDLKAELERRMRGEAPRPLTNAELDKLEDAKKDVSDMEQKDDETYEEWVQRVAESKAQKAVETQLHQYQAQQVRQTLLQAVESDPLREPVINVIRQAVQAKKIPPAVIQQADEDPEAFKWIYDTARQAVVGMMHNQMISNQQAQPPQQVPQQPSQSFSPQKKAAPKMESGSRATRNTPSSKKQAIDRQVIKDMNSGQFMDLVEMVKSGALSR